MKRVFNDIQIKFIKDNHKTMTYVDMSKLEIFKGLTDKQIRNKARSLGIKKTREFNDKYFEIISTKERAYFLGLIYADGYITDYSELGISLHFDDKYILEVLNEQLGNVHNIKERIRKNSYNGYDYTSHTADLRIYSKPLCDDLIKHGIMPRKTKSNIFPLIEDNLFSHFLRGYFDGDGCIYKHNKQGYNMVHFTCGSKSFLEYLFRKIENKLNITGKIYKEKDKKYRLMYYKQADAKILLEYIYKDSDGLRLERKYKKHLYIGSPMKETIG